jgi:hypothetical protein
MAIERRKSKRSVCNECRVRNTDVSPKRLYPCQLCEGWFCEYHLTPKLVYIRDLRSVIKDPKWRLFVEKEIKRDDGHPCMPYTRYKIKEIELEEHAEQELMTKLLSPPKRVRKSRDTQCFIATAVYGTQFAHEVGILKNFRDLILTKSLAGRVFINAYYIISPLIVHIISKSCFIKSIIRNFMIKPLLHKLKEKMVV